MCLDNWYAEQHKTDGKKRRDGWSTYVKDMWRTFKWIRGITAVWDLAVHNDDGSVISPDATRYI
eukprot:4891723-Amphidinium_carterae.1